MQLQSSKIVIFHKYQMSSLSRTYFLRTSLGTVLCFGWTAWGNYVTKPDGCMDADGLFRGDATLKKIFCLQETLRGVDGRPPLTESLLQPDRVLFLPSPLLWDKTAASQTPDKRVRCHLTPSLFQRLLQMQAYTNTHSHTHTHTHTSLVHKGTYI